MKDEEDDEVAMLSLKRNYLVHKLGKGFLSLNQAMKMLWQKLFLLSKAV